MQSHYTRVGANKEHGGSDRHGATKEEAGLLRKGDPPLGCLAPERARRRMQRSCYLRNLRATRPPPTSRAPAPSANSVAALVPPVFGSSAFAAGAGAGAGAAPGGGGGGGAAFGGGGGGGGGAHGALATTPPAFASITPSLHSASAF